MDNEAPRGPGRPPKPKMARVRLLHGYVPSVYPDGIAPEGGVLPKAASGSVIDVPEDEAKRIVGCRVAELAFPDDELDWMSEQEKRERKTEAERVAMKQRLAMLYAQKMAGS